MNERVEPYRNRPWLVVLLVVLGWSSKPAVGVEMEVSTSALNIPESAGLRVEGGAIQLRLDEAVEVALRRNLSLVVERYRRQQSRQGIFQTEGIYDLLATANLTAADRTSPAASQLEGADVVEVEQQTLSLGLTQLFPTGATASLLWRNSRFETNNQFVFLNPRYDMGLEFSLRQPLLQGFGRQVTERNILVARLGSNISRELFEQQVIATLRDVENAYWGLVEAKEQLKVAEESLRLARELHEQNKIRVEVGTLAPLELVQSEAGIATREEEIIRAQAAVGDAEDRLRLLLNLKEADLWQMPIQPETDPTTARVEIDLGAAIQTALAERPELQTRRLEVETRELDAAVFRNQKLPRVDLTVTYGYSGLGGDFLVPDPGTGERQRVPGGISDALNQIADLEFDSWAVGVSFAFPLQNRTARAQSTIANLALDQARTELDELDQAVRIEVRNAVRQVETAAKQIDSARASRILQERNLDAERKRFENGMSTSFQVLLIQEDLTAAQSREIAAITNYRRALVEYYRAIGRLLEETGVELTDN